jgi:hypothetical protein
VEYIRERGDIIEVYKNLHGIYNDEHDDLLPYHETTGVATRGHSFKLRKMEHGGQIRAKFFSMRHVDSKRVELADRGHHASTIC